MSKRLIGPQMIGGEPAPNLPIHRVKRECRYVCLYMRQGVRIVCTEDRKDE